MSLSFHEAALAEAAQVASRYCSIRDRLGDDFASELEMVLGDIADRADTYPLLETCPGAWGIRRALLRRFPYVVIYESDGANLRILAVMHTSRHPRYWTKRRTQQ